jgi:hypothetical protein
MVNSLHVGHGGRSNHQTGHAEETSDRQLAGQEGMFHFTDRTFDGCSEILAILLAQSHFASPFGYCDLRWKKGQTEGGALFPRPSRTALFEKKRTGLAEVWVEVRPVTTPATAQLDRQALSLGAGDAGWNSQLVLLNLEIG